MENNHENEFEKKPYDPDTQYGFPSRNNSTSRGYNLNGTYYESTSNYEDYADVESKGQEYESQDRDTQNHGTDIYGQNTYTSGAQGMANNITPPLDKKGRPLKNKFASRLAWGIILIVGSFLVGLGMAPVYIATILSIIAIVFAFQQNVAYTQGDWDTYKRKAKTSGILLWIAGIIIVIWIAILVVAGVWLYREYSASDELKDLFNSHQDYTYTDTTEDPDVYEEASSQVDDEGNDSYEYTGKISSRPKDFNVFTIEETEISVPLSVKEFQKTGFELKENALKESIDPQNDSGFAYYTKDGQYLGTLFITNNTDEKIKAKDGVIETIVISNYNGADATFVGGLHMGESTMEDVIDVLGSDYISKSEYDNRVYMQWRYTEDTGTRIETDFLDGKLNEVWIVNEEETK